MSIGKGTARRLSAVLVAAAGVMNIVSALLPALPSRMEILADLVPIHLVRGAQTATVLTGFLLILLADGLRKRRRRAFQLAVALLAVSTVLNMVKGLDYEEALAAAVLGLVLISLRDVFDLPSPLPTSSGSVQAIAAVCMLFYGYVLGGFFILHSAVHPAPTLINATQEPFRLLVDASHFRYHTNQAQWFERSLACLACFVVLYALVVLLRPLVPRRPSTHGERERVRDLLAYHGSDSLSYFALQHDRSYFFDPSGNAFLSYRVWGNVALVAGDPIGPGHLVPELVGSFLSFAESGGLEPCFLGAGSDHLHLYRSLGLRTLKIGEEALIDLPQFDVAALKRKVRRAVRHIEDLGIHIETHQRGELTEAKVAQMNEVSGEWVAQNGGQRGFSMTLGRLPDESDRDCEVVIALEGSYVWGYLALVPVYGASGWSLDAMRRRSNSPNGLMECLIIRAAETYRERGCRFLSLNFATLCNSENDIESRALEATRKFLYENLSSFYQLDSLYQFNSKFHPRWRSRYLAYRDVLQIPKLALAIVQSEDPVRIPSLGGLFRRGE